MGDLGTDFESLTGPLPVITLQGRGEFYSEMSTLERIKKLFLENFDIPEERLLPQATIESLGLDSLDKIDFLFALEKEFDVRIPDREVTLVTLQDVISVIDRLAGEQQLGKGHRSP